MSINVSEDNWSLYGLSFAFFFICVAYEAFVQHILSFFFCCHVCLCADWLAPGRLCCVVYHGLNTSTFIHYHEAHQNYFVYFVNLCVSFDQMWCFISVPIYFIAPTLYHLLHRPLTFHGLVLLTRVSSILWLWYFVIVRVKFIFESRSHLQHSARPYVVVSLLTCLSSMWERVLYFFLFSLQYLITYVCLLWPELFFFA